MGGFREEWTWGRAVPRPTFFAGGPVRSGARAVFTKASPHLWLARLLRMDVPQIETSNRPPMGEEEE